LLLKNIGIDAVIDSQIGVLRKKRFQRVSRSERNLIRAELLGNVSVINHEINKIKKKIAFCTNASWGKTKDIDNLNKNCGKHIRQLSFYVRLNCIVESPLRIVRKVLSKICLHLKIHESISQIKSIKLFQ
jgi:hypothetical protein